MGFIFDMNYKKVYDNIIQNRLENPLTDSKYGENHHIIPKSLGGSDCSNNIVRLTAREHFICHALLAEMYDKETPEWYKMNHAFMMMKCESTTQCGNRYFNSRLYELKRKDFSLSMSYAQTGKNNSQYGKVWIHNLEIESSIKVHKLELDSYLKTNWILGRVIDFKRLKVKHLPKNTLHYNSRNVTNVVLQFIDKVFGIKEDVDINTILKLKNVLYEKYVIENMSTTQLADYYNSTNPTIRNYLLWLGIGTRNKAGKWE